MLNNNVWGAKCIPTFAVLFLACLWINSHCLLNSHYLLNSHSLIINSHYLLNSHCLINSDKKRTANVGTRGGVENTRLVAKDTKKIRGKGQGQPFRGQTLSRPRTGMLEAKAKDQGHSKIKRSSKKFFRQSPIYRCCQNFWLGRPKPHITCNDVIKNLPVGT